MVPLPVKYVITSPLSLARVLWWYGEDDMWASALGLAPAVVAGLAPRFAELRSAPELVDVLWSGAPLADAYLVLGAIEHLEGHPRPAVRRQRRAAPLPDVLDRSETERWHDPLLAEVFRVVQDRPGHSRSGRSPGSCRDWADAMPVVELGPGGTHRTVDGAGQASVARGW